MRQMNNDGVDEKDVKVIENKRPSDNLSKREAPKGLIERLVTQKQVIALQDVRRGNTGMVGFKPHKVNNIIPVVASTNEIIPDNDNSIGLALFNPEVTNEAKVDQLLKEIEKQGVQVNSSSVSKQFAELTDGKKALEDERAALAKERAEFEAEKKANSKEDGALPVCFGNYDGRKKKCNEECGSKEECKNKE